ncbi:hypothetical protein KAR91_47485 [Candidatus Pacearchaeota archaeon]|nr:hypothetical protein [Candidatus Pacearchaeota archaeon]
MDEQKFNKIVGTDGKFFKVIFRKKSGDKRTMVCRRGVSKYVVGSTGKGKPHVDDLINVWEPSAGNGKEAYRSFYSTSIVELHAHGHTYDGNGNELKTA